jgi:hypothetical protein
MSKIIFCSMVNNSCLDNIGVIISLLFISSYMCRSKSKLCYERRSVGQSVLVSSTHLGFNIRFLLLSDSYEFVDVGRPLWREGGFVVYNCCWSSPAQSFSRPSHAELMTPQPGGAGPHVYISLEQTGPVIFPGTGFPFPRLLPHGIRVCVC